MNSRSRTAGPGMQPIKCDRCLDVLIPVSVLQIQYEKGCSKPTPDGRFTTKCGWWRSILEARGSFTGKSFFEDKKLTGSWIYPSELCSQFFFKSSIRWNCWRRYPNFGYPSFTNHNCCKVQKVTFILEQFLEYPINFLNTKSNCWCNNKFT